MNSQHDGNRIPDNKKQGASSMGKVTAKKHNHMKRAFFPTVIMLIRASIGSTRRISKENAGEPARCTISMLPKTSPNKKSQSPKKMIQT